MISHVGFTWSIPVGVLPSACVSMFIVEATDVRRPLADERIISSHLSSLENRTGNFDNSYELLMARIVGRCQGRRASLRLADH